jgi:hypothetical protein
LLSFDEVEVEWKTLGEVAEYSRNSHQLKRDTNTVRL